jgi:hypothetical protein
MLFPITLVPTSATEAVVTTLVAPLRSLYLRNLNIAAGDYMVVTFEYGEIFTIQPGEQLVIYADDCSPEAVSGKIFSRTISTFGNALNPVLIEANYTAYVNQHSEGRTKVEIC